MTRYLQSIILLLSVSILALFVSFIAGIFHVPIHLLPSNFRFDDIDCWINPCEVSNTFLKKRFYFSAQTRGSEPIKYSVIWPNNAIWAIDQQETILELSFRDPDLPRSPTDVTTIRWFDITPITIMTARYNNNLVIVKKDGSVHESEYPNYTSLKPVTTDSGENARVGANKDIVALLAPPEDILVVYGEDDYYYIESLMSDKIAFQIPAEYQVTIASRNTVLYGTPDMTEMRLLSSPYNSPIDIAFHGDLIENFSAISSVAYRRSIVRIIKPITIASQSGQIVTPVFVTPALVVWPNVFFLIISFVAVYKLWNIRHQAQEYSRETFPHFESDIPIDNPADATDDSFFCADRITRFVCNVDSSAPFTFAVVGEWGSGKSSILNLIAHGLKEHRHPFVQFNAWHHHREEHVFAALISSIRVRVVRYFRSIPFTAKLSYLRTKKYPIKVLLFFFSAVLLIYVSVTIIRSFVGGDGDLSSIWLVVSVLVYLLLTNWNPFRIFGVSPAGVIRSSGKLKIPFIEDRVSFRYQVGEAFSDVTLALGTRRRLVILVDDLDRCMPTQVAEVLEAVSLLTSSGKCFVVLAMDLAKVTRALGFYYKDVADQDVVIGGEGRHTMADVDDGNRTSCDRAFDTYEAAAAVLNSRDRFAEDYLRKIINVQVSVPSVGIRDVGSNK